MRTGMFHALVHACPRARRAWLRAGVRFGAVLAVMVAGLVLSAPASAMQIVSGPEAKVGVNAVSISWHSDAAGSSEVYWGAASHSFPTQYESSKIAETSSGTLHSVTLGFVPDGTWHFRVRTAASDGAATSADATFTVNAGQYEARNAWGVNAGVNSVVKAGGYTYIGGSFTEVGRPTGGGMRVEIANGDLRPDDLMPDDAIMDSVSDGAGGWYVIGGFSRIGGFDRNGIAHVLADGGVDPYFGTSGGPGGTGGPVSIDRAGNWLYIGGSFTSWDGSATGANRLVRIDAVTGAVDRSFTDGTGLDNLVHELTVSGGSLYVAGIFTTYNGSAVGAGRLMKLDATTGAIDAAFTDGSGFDASVETVVVNGGSVYVGGNFTTYNGAAPGAGRLAKLDATTGSIDTTFTDGTGFDSWVFSLDVSGGYVYAVGQFASFNGSTTAAGRMARLDSTGAIDTAFTDGFGLTNGGSARSVVVVGGWVYVGGYQPDYNGVTTGASSMLRANATTGALDTTWTNGAGPDRAVTSISSDGTHLMLGGAFSEYEGVSRGRIARFTDGWKLDTSWPSGAGFNNTVEQLATDGTSVYAGGSFTQWNGSSTAAGRIARLVASTGAIDAAFTKGTGFNSTVRALDVTSTSVYAGGDFTSYNGSAAADDRLARLDLTGTLDGAFTDGAGFDGSVRVLRSSGGQLYAGGLFTQYNSSATAAGHLARLDGVTGAIDATYTDGAGFSSDVYAIEPDGAGGMYVGGAFTQYNSSATAAGRIAHLAADGTIDAAFTDGTGFSTTVFGIKRVGTRLFVAGGFTSYNGAAPGAWGYASMDTAGALDPTFLYAGGTHLSSHTGTGLSYDDERRELMLLVQNGGSNTTRLLARGAIAALAAIDLADVPSVTITAAPTVVQTTHQVSIGWTTDVPATSLAAWGPSSTGWTAYPNRQSGQAVAGSTSHSVTIAHLTPGTYHYRVRSVGVDGGSATSADLTFTVAPYDDDDPLGTLVSDGSVQAIDQDDQGRIYLGGSFTRIGERLGGGSRVSIQTGARQPFTPQVAGDVYDALPDGSGGWYIAGEFSRVGAYTRGGIAHILPDGGVDPAFATGAGFNGIVFELAMSGGFLYASGSFTSYDGTARGNIAKISASTGALDTAFAAGAGFDLGTRAIAVSGTSVYVTGQFSQYNGSTTAAGKLAKLNMTTGAIDTTFTDGTGLNNTGYALLVDGTNLIVGGMFTSYNGSAGADDRVMRVNATTGAIDATYTDGTGFTGGAGTVWDLATDGTYLYVAGSFTSYNGAARSGLAKVALGTAAIDASWNNGAGIAGGDAYSITIDGGFAYVGGLFSSYAGTARGNAARIATSGTGAIDTTWMTGTGYDDKVLVLQPSQTSANDVYVGGAFNTQDGAVRSNLARLNRDLTLDSWAATGTDGFVNDLVVAGNRVFIGGTFTSVLGSARSNGAALTTTGSLLSWGNAGGFDNPIRAIKLIGPWVYVGGFFSTFNGSTTGAGRLARFNPVSGVIDTSYTDGTGFNAQVYDIEGTTGGPVYVTGNFTQYNGGAVGTGRLAKLDGSSGAIDTAFTDGTGFDVSGYSLALDGTYLYVGGDFTTYNGAGAVRLRRVNATSGALDAGWNPCPGLSDIPWELERSGTRFYATGDWTNCGASTRRGAARVTTAGAVDGWNAGGGIDMAAGAFDVETLDDGRIGLGLTGRRFNNVPNPGFAILDGPDLADVTIATGPTVTQIPHAATVAWTTSLAGSSSIAWSDSSAASWEEYRYHRLTTATAVSMGTRHSVTLNDLDTGTWYYRVRTTTPDGATVTSPEQTLTVAAARVMDPTDALSFGSEPHVGASLISPSVNASVPDGTGGWYVGGDFATVGTKVPLPVTIDTEGDLVSIPGVNGTVKVVEPDGTGGWLIGGEFSRVGGHVTSNLARLLPDGQVDTTFVSPLNTTVHVASITSDGTNVFTLDDGSTIIRKFSLATGAVVAGWPLNSWTGGSIAAIEVSGGYVYAGGSFTAYNGSAGADDKLARIDATTGVLDAAFTDGTGFNGTVYDLDVVGGTIYVAGGFSSYNGSAGGDDGVAKLDATTGTLDAAFTDGVGLTGGTAYAVAVGSGSVYVGGNFTSYNGLSVGTGRIVELDASTGAIDNTFTNGTGFNATVLTLTVTATNVYVGGIFTNYDGVTTGAQRLAKLDTSGNNDTTWTNGTGPNGGVTSIATNGLITMVGTDVSYAGIALTGMITGYDQQVRGGVAHILRDGTVDPAFGNSTGFNNSVNALELDGAGSLYVGGSFTQFNGSATGAGKVAKLDAATGAIDTTYTDGTGFSGTVFALESIGTSLFVGGNFTTFNGAAPGAGEFARLDSTGAIDTTFTNGAGFVGGSVNDILAIGSDLVVVGAFTTYAGASAGGIAKLTSSSADPVAAFNSVGTGFDSGAVEVTYAYGQLYVGGTFQNYDGVTADYAARLDPTTGARDLGFTFAGTGLDITVRGIAPVGGSLLLFGPSSVNGSTMATGAVLVKRDGSRDTRMSIQGGHLKTVNNRPGFDPLTGRVFVGYSYSGGLNGSHASNLVGSIGHAEFDPCQEGTICYDVPEQLTLGVDAATRALGTSQQGQNVFGTTTVSVTTNAFRGYTLTATDASNSSGAICSSAGFACTNGVTGIPDWTGTDASPSVWAFGTAGYFGITVRSASLGSRLAKWGPGTGTAENDVTNNRFAGLKNSTTVTLHSTDRFVGTDDPIQEDVAVTYRANVSTTQLAGPYQAAISYTAVANP